MTSGPDAAAASGSSSSDLPPPSSSGLNTTLKTSPDAITDNNDLEVGLRARCARELEAMIGSCAREWKLLKGDERAAEQDVKDLQAWFQPAIAGLKTSLEQKLTDVDTSSEEEMLDLEQSWVKERDSLLNQYFAKTKLITGAPATPPVVSRRSPFGRLIGRIESVQIQDPDKPREDGKGKGIILYILDRIPGTKQDEACNHHDAVHRFYEYVATFWADIGQFAFSELHRGVFLSWPETEWAMIPALKELVFQEGTPSASFTTAVQDQLEDE